MTEDPGRAEGLFESLRNLARTFLAVVQTRIEIFASEIDEGRARLARVAVLAAIAALCIALAVACSYSFSWCCSGTRIACSRSVSWPAPLPSAESPPASACARGFRSGRSSCLPRSPSCARTGRNSRGDERASSNPGKARAAPRRGGSAAEGAAREALPRGCRCCRHRSAAPQARARLERARAHAVAGRTAPARRDQARGRRTHRAVPSDHG